MAANRRASLLDDEQLEANGRVPELSRNFSLTSLLGLSFAILNSWTALSSSLSLALPSGGPVAVLYGLLLAGVYSLSLSASLAEFLSAIPSAGGQYEFTAAVAPDRLKVPLSYVCGWLASAGWVALNATGPLLGSQLISGCISLQHPDYEPQRWQQFLIYIGITLIGFFINAFGNSLLNHFNQAALCWSISGFVIICITVLATSRHDYASADFVFTTFVNQTGWPDGLAWLLGLLQGSLGLIGFDATSHMIEEIPNPTTTGPKIMLACVVMGLVTGFIFLMVLLFVSGGSANLDNLISSPLGPLLQILYTATKSQAGAICLLIFPLICLVFATTSIMTTASRMIYAFARDRGVPFPGTFSKVNSRLGMPLNSLILTAALVIVFGLIFLGSSAAFNAITSASVVALNLSYAMPIVLNVLKGRAGLPPRPFTLPPLLGWAANLVGIAFVALTSILFLFPPAIPVDASNMNYCCVAFGIVLIIALVYWVLEGRKTYHGPASIHPDILVATSSIPVQQTMSGNEAHKHNKLPKNDKFA